MVRNNNVISANHFHKDWQRYVRVNFAQPMRKKQRCLLRKRALRRAMPGPMEPLRPVVRCPTVRYHTKGRVGRGFALAELKHVGLTQQWARSIGIAVDYRRRCKSMESLLQNGHRLQEYMSRLILFPFKQPKKRNIIAQISNTVLQVKNINDLEKSKSFGYKARKITDEEKKFEAFQTLRLARGEIKKNKRQLKQKAKFNAQAGI